VGATLLAILTGALLLPGIVATWFFYRSAQTKEVDPVLPALTSPEGIAQLGGFSLLAHFLYSTLLWLISRLPHCFELPLANPYIFTENQFHALGSVTGAWTFFSGLFCLCVLAALVGALAGEISESVVGKGLFYGPLSEVYLKGEGANRFITAYVLTKVEADGKAIGYEGTVESLARDGDRYPTKVILRDASIFYLEFTADGPVRHECGNLIDWIVLTSEEWHNIAFQVFELSDD